MMIASKDELNDYSFSDSSPRHSGGGDSLAVVLMVVTSRRDDDGKGGTVSRPRW